MVKCSADDCNAPAIIFDLPTRKAIPEGNCFNHCRAHYNISQPAWARGLRDGDSTFSEQEYIEDYMKYKLNNP